MPNPAANIRTAVGRAVKARTRNGFVFAHPDPAKADLPIEDAGTFVAATGPIHTAAGDELDSDWQPDPFEFDHRTVLLDHGTVARMRENISFNPYQVERLGESILLSFGDLSWTNELDQVDQIGSPSGTTSPAGASMRWVGAYGSGLDVEVVPHIAGRVRKFLHVESAASLPTPGIGGTQRLQWRIGFNASNGLTPHLSDGSEFSPRNNTTTLIDDGVIEWRLDDGTVMGWFVAPRAWDSSDVPAELPVTLRVRRQGPNLIAWVEVPKADLDAAVYPVVIDPTYDAQVAAGADDGIWKTNTSGYVNNAQTDGVGYYFSNTSSWARWDGVTVPAAATVSDAYVRLVSGGQSGMSASNEITLRFAMEDANDPTAPTTAGDADGRTQTTAYTDYLPTTSNWPASGTSKDIDLTSSVQEIVTDHHASGEAMQLLILEQTQSGSALIVYHQYDSTSENGPWLYVTYSSGTTVTLGVPTVAATAPAVTVELANTTTLGVPTVTATAPALSVALANTVTLGVPTVVTSAPAVSVALAHTVTLGVPTVTTSAPAVSVALAHTVTLGVPTVTTTAPAVSVALAHTVTLGVPTVTTTAPAITVVQGGAAQTVTLGVPTVTTSAPAVGVALANTVTLGVPEVVASIPAEASTDAYFVFDGTDDQISEPSDEWSPVDFTLVVKAQLADWSPDELEPVPLMAADYSTPSGSSLTLFVLNDTGDTKIQVAYRVSSTAYVLEYTTDVFVDGNTYWIKVEADRDGYASTNYLGTFYYRVNDGDSWTELGTDNGSNVDINQLHADGAYRSGYHYHYPTPAGFDAIARFHEATFYAGLGEAGTVHAHLDASDYVSGTTFTDPETSATITVAGSPSHTTDVVGGSLDISLANTLTLGVPEVVTSAPAVEVVQAGGAQTVTLGVPEVVTSAPAVSVALSYTCTLGVPTVTTSAPAVAVTQSNTFTLGVPTVVTSVPALSITGGAAPEWVHFHQETSDVTGFVSEPSRVTGHESDLAGVTGLTHTRTGG